MRRRAILFALTVALAGCGLRTLTILFHTPETCPAPVGEEETDCPYAAIRSVHTRLLRQDGSTFGDHCAEVAQPLCDTRDLEGFVFLQRSEASDGIEVIVEGRAMPGCEGPLVLACDSFGTAVIDLTEADEIPMWCDCPRVVTPP